ncbi:pentatricopeptide repeat-containing protein At4g31850, chloroplastic isoform X3 [Humulus lupulus]|uniref:pentatricopeptide repeat-containing protein At4g31850, chloroplastic isoform X3 n=1 Tax=Humulus lupulus TaxID=3486 RepID=UPI002B40FA69|nr:pentatricopeptide repeat-containing protein At4g31850, chloroplastic isoform X3 [Humulus lupulus]
MGMELMAGVRASQPNCIFCQIATKSTSTTLLHSDDKIVAFQDIRPATFRSKARSKRMGLCGFVMKISKEGDELAKVKKKVVKSSEEVTRVLKSTSDPNSAFSYFMVVADLPYVVHTPETCNYMLEVLMTHKRVEDMAAIFDFMQKKKGFVRRLWRFTRE